jgi:sugar/nucleoside kinase (ribokinase family)
MEEKSYDITRDDLSQFANRGPAFVTMGEAMIRDTPADMERPERTRLIRLSIAGSEYSLATALSRFGIPSSYITRVPDNPYGWALRNTAREQGVNVDHIVWAPATEPIGRFIYEIGRTPRQSKSVYQRMFSLNLRLDAGMVDWTSALQDARLFHSAGITFGLAAHSRYERNYNCDAYREAIASKPRDCLVGMDLNYRTTLWTVEQARETLTPIISEHVDILITTLADMAKLYGIGCGQYSARQIAGGEIDCFDDGDIRDSIQRVLNLFGGEDGGPDHSLSRLVRAASLGISGHECRRRILSLAQSTIYNPVGSAGRRRHVDRRFLLRLADRRSERRRAGEGSTGRRRGDVSQADTDVRPPDNR